MKTNVSTVKLNSVNLNSVRLNHVSLNSLGIERTRRKTLPEELVKKIDAVYIVKGATNGSLFQNHVLKDLSGKGHDLKLFNFAFKGRSGVNPVYLVFTNEQANAGKGHITDEWRSIIVRYGDYDYRESSNVNYGSFFTRWHMDYVDIFDNFKIRVSGLDAGMSFVFGTVSGSIFGDSTIEQAIIDIDADGLYEFKVEKRSGYDFYLRIRRSDGKIGYFSSPVKIELLSNYEGALGFDGVDDYAIIQNYPKGFKAIMMVCRPDTGVVYDQRIDIYGSNFRIDGYGGNSIAYKVLNNGKTYINGILNKKLTAERLRRVVHLIGITNQNVNPETTQAPMIGKGLERSSFSSVIFYSFVGFNEIPTNDEMNRVADYYRMNEYIEDI